MNGPDKRTLAEARTFVMYPKGDTREAAELVRKLCKIVDGQAEKIEDLENHILELGETD